MHIEFYGATSGITGSCHILRANGHQVLLDCGLIQGRRKVSIDGEEKWMTVSGVVRAFDVDSANTVSSHLIANASVTYKSSGRLAQNTKRGWLDTVLDYVWPF